MKRKAQAPTLFEDMPSEAEPLFAGVKPAPARFHRPDQTEDGETRWIKSRAAVLVRCRGMAEADALALAREELAEFCKT